MLELHTRQVDTVDATAIKRARKNEKEQLRGDKAEVLLKRQEQYRNNSIYWDPVCIGTPFVLEKIII